MSQNVPENSLTAQQEKAALLAAQGDLTTAQIGRKVGVSRKTIERWKQQDQFKDRVAQCVEEIRKAVLSHGIADKVERVRALEDRWRRMQQVITERAVDKKLQKVPGGKTGLIVHQVKGVGKGESFKMVDLYAVDTSLLKEIREHERQAAMEIGDWTEKHEHSGPGGSPISVTVNSALDKVYGDPPANK